MNKLLSAAKLKRQFIAVDLQIENWSDVESYFTNLQTRNLQTVSDLELWLSNRSELDSVLEEEMAWRYIRMNCNTADEAAAQLFNHFVSTIEPQAQTQSNELDKKLVESPLCKQLDHAKYQTILRIIEQQIKLFRDENVPIIAELQQESQQYGVVNSQMMVEHDGQEMTLQRAANLLKDTNRKVRETIYRKISDCRQAQAIVLDDLFTSLLKKRHAIAKNAGFETFRDYKMAELCRFDYSVDDCFAFHEAIRTRVMPLVHKLNESRRRSLQLDSLRPWDLDVDAQLLPPLHPFTDGTELITKAIACFTEIRPQYGAWLQLMHDNSYLDLESRKGKAPGGFNYPLYESNVPFIYMNATGNLRDVETMVHEGGHAVHSFLSAHLPLVGFKNLPSEVAELASMSMELISMEHWQHFFTNADDLKRAKRSQLEGIVGVLPWIATIDKFQHWLYTNPTHTTEQRQAEWLKIIAEFGDPAINFEGLEAYRVWGWQKQLHLYEVPFYYIEYGIAQLGALAIWKNYKENPEKALNQYEAALRLGYSVSIPELYATAGISFNFSKSYIEELMQLLEKEIDVLL